MKPRCDWEVPDTLSASVCGDIDMQTGRICYPLGGGGGGGSGGIRKAPFKNCMTPSKVTNFFSHGKFKRQSVIN